MEEEYLSDLSSSFDEEQLPQRKKAKRNDSNINNNNNNHNYGNDNNNNNNNNYGNDNNNNNNNNYNYQYNGINASTGTNFNVNDDNLNNNQLNSIFMDPRIREEQELIEAINLSLIETGRGNALVPRFEDNFSNTNGNSMNLETNFNRNPQMSYQSDEHHHRHRNKKRDTGNQNAGGEVSIEQIIIQSKKEEEDTKIIRDFLANKENLLATLVELPGVDPKDPCFEEFFG